jgi:hypothetical protein
MFHGVIKKGHLGVMKNDFFFTLKYFTSVTFKEDILGTEERTTVCCNYLGKNVAKQNTQKYSNIMLTTELLLLLVYIFFSSLVCC